MNGRMVGCFALLVVACGGASTDSWQWVGSTATHGDTTVVTTDRGGTWNLAGPIRIDSVEVLWNGGNFRTSSQVTVAEDGTIYAAERNQVDVIYPDGSVGTPIGRAGQGPGEFEDILGVYAGGSDSLLVWDGGDRRITLFDRQGRVITTHPVLPPARLQGPQAVELFPNPAGIPIAWNLGLVAPDAPPDTFALMLGVAMGDSTHWRSLTVLRDMQWTHVGGMLGPKHAFGERPLVAVGPDGMFAVSQGAEYWVNWSNMRSSRVVRVVRRVDRVPVGGHIAEIPASVLTRVPPALRESFEGLASAGNYGKVRNSIEALRLDDEGRLWVHAVTSSDTLNPMLSHWYPEGRAPRFLWDLYEHDGKRLGAVELPSRFTPRAFRKGVMYGIYEEEDGNNAVAKIVLPLSVEPSPR